MKYIITKACCKFSDKSSKVISYSACSTEENTCDNVEEFRNNLKQKLNTSLEILGITVENIYLTYEEDDRE